jgi:branched-chain amino acid transport system substrate-binding protein
MGSGDVTDDDLLNPMGDAALGIITAHQYSAAHPSATNAAFVAGFRKFTGTRPNYVSVAAYDGMRVIYEALKKTSGDADGDKLIAGMKGLSFESPRGPVTIEPETRDIIQNIYIRRVDSGWRALQRRDRNIPCGEGPDQGLGEIGCRRFERHERGETTLISSIRDSSG